MGTKEKIDGHDRAILEILTKDARSSLRKMAAKVKLSPSSIRNRINRLEQIGAIERFTIDVNHRMLGQEIQVLVLLTCRPGSSEDLYDTLSEYEQVHEIYWTAGPANFILVVRVVNMTDLSTFITGSLERIQGIDKIETLFLMPRPSK